MQTRFTTEWDTDPNPAYDIWTSVNGSEIVPGVISPLIATTFNRFDYIGLRRLMATYAGGAKVRLIAPPVANFFGIFGGRLALNNALSVASTSLLNAETAQAILQQFFTGASGGERYIIDTDESTRQRSAKTAAAQRDAATKILAGWRAALYGERSTDRFERDRALDLAAAWERWNELWEENTSTYLNLHYVVSVAAAENQVALAGVMQAGGGDPNVVVALCSGLGEVESAQPALRLYDLAQEVRDRPTVRGAFDQGDFDLLLTRLAGAHAVSDEWSEFAEAFDRFLFDYGYRGQGEADPSNPDWAEQPRFVLSQIRSMLAIPTESSPQAAMARAVEDRKALEAKIREGLPTELHEPFDTARTAAQHFTRLRELSKATWILAARRLRAPYLALSHGLALTGAIASEDDAAFLTYDEVGAFATGGNISDADERIERRRKQFVDAENYRLPDNWVGVSEPRAVAQVAIGTTTLTGLGVSIGPGPVTGTARIIPSAEAGLARELNPGDILVAPFTDAPWTPLFVVAGAVVVETGGVLSHAATVARELGLPAVVMVADATRIIHEGDTVVVDGAAGTVTITSND